MITLTRKEAEQVLDALEVAPYMSNKDDHEHHQKAIETLRARLAEPEKQQEPILWLYDFPNPDSPETEIVQDWTAYNLDEVTRNKGVNVRPLYLAPPHRL